MKIIIASDIFGKTPALEELANSICGNTLIVDPYDGASMAFNNESDAYRYFSKHVTLERYCTILQEHVVRCSGPTTIIGFSVGASALWRLSPSLEAPIQAAIGIYSAQIRHYLNIIPNVPFHLIFPQKEPHFDVDAVSHSLNDTPNVTITSMPYDHGYMNRHSANFDEKGYRHTLEKLNNEFLPFTQSRLLS